MARNGRSGRTEHFAHYSGHARICEAGRETSAHLLAKDILAERLWLWLPPVVAEFDGERIDVAPARKLTFDKAVLEHRLGDLIPDVVLHLGDKRLLVEVRVTHVDRHGRSVASCRVDDEDLGAWLVRGEFAVRQRATRVRPI